MTGVEDGRLLAYLDGELGPEERVDLEAWLDERPEVRERLEEVRARRRAVAELLAELPATAPDTDEVRDRVRLEVRAAVSGGHGTKTTRGLWSRRSRLAQAATVLLLLAGGAAAATVPGSPLRSLLGLDAPAPVATDAPEATPAPVEEVGVRVRPAGGRLVVVLSGLSDGGDVTVELVDDAQGAVFAPRGTRFRSGSGRIEAATEGGGAVRVLVPRSVAEASIRVDGRVYLEKRGERVELPGPAAQVSGDRYRFGGS